MRTYDWEHFALCRHPNTFCDHKYCDSRDIMFLICDVNSRNHMFEVATLPCLLDIDLV